LVNAYFAISQFLSSYKKPAYLSRSAENFQVLALVSLSDTHEVKSNHESGYGRYDVMLIPKDIEQLGIVIEFKTVRDEKVDLNSAAAEALEQIEHRAYATELKQRGFQHILKMGLAFRNKEVTMKTQFDV
jgi:PD-(D/E)XK nuclease superfamily